MFYFFIIESNLKSLSYFFDACENKLKQSLKKSDALVWCLWEQTKAITKKEWCFSL